MLELVVDNTYKESSATENDMKMTVIATRSETVITRLVAGVELALKQSGKHWTLTAKPEKSK
jgi:hypothetical protein